MNISIQSLARAISANDWAYAENPDLDTAPRSQVAGEEEFCTDISPPADARRSTHRPRDPYFYVELI